MGTDQRESPPRGLPSEAPSRHVSGIDSRRPRSIDLEEGTLIAGKYRLVRPAGFGGMAAVWVARNEATGAEVAVKLLLTDRTESRAAFERFRREAHAAAKLSHRAIVRIFDLLELPEAPGSLAIVMELLHGRTLGEAMEDKRKFTVVEALDILMPVLSGLAHAHRAGVVHRDLKPENVFLSVDPDDQVMPKVLDFGISKLTTAQVPPITTDGAMLGTPSYMSPEQARGALDADARSDVFTVGILLYQMLAGRNPFTSESYHSVVAAILERDPDPISDIPAALWAVLERALRKAPAERYRDASALAAAIRAAVGPLAGRPSQVSLNELPGVSSIPELQGPPSEDEPAMLPIGDREVAVPGRKRSRVAAGLAIAAVLVLAVGVGVVVWAGQPMKSVPVPAPGASTVAASSAPILALTPPATTASTPAPATTATTTATATRTGLAAPAATTGAKASPSASTRAGKRPTTVVRDPGF